MITATDEHMKPERAGSDPVGRALDVLSAPPLPVVFGFLALILGAVYLGIFIDDDIYYIIALGRSIIADGIPWTDPLTCNEGLSCVAQQWLFCVGAAALHDGFGMPAVAAATVALWAVAAACLYAAARAAAPRRPCAAACATGAALFMLCMFAKTNPRALDVICLAICALAMERLLAGGRRGWLAVPVAASAAMANLHGSMWVLAAAPVLCALLDGRAGGRRREIACALVLTCAASAASPYGLDGTLFIFRSLGGLEVLNIAELNPTTPSIGSCGVLAATPFALAAYAFLRGKQVSSFNDARMTDALMAAFGVLALLQLRNVMLLLAVAPMAMLLASERPLADDRSLAERLRRLATLFVTLAAAMILILACAIPDSSEQKADKAASRDRCAAALAASGVEEGASIGNELNSGSYLEFMGYKPAFDGRAELLLPQVNGKLDLAALSECLLNGTNEQTMDWIAENDFDALWLCLEPIFEHQNERMRIAASALGYSLVYSDDRNEAYVRGDLRS